MTIDMRKEMPVLARHEGEWKGEYIHVTPDNEILDRHASHLICSFPSDGDFNYFQKNIYTWDDGKREEIDFPLSIETDASGGTTSESKALPGS